MLAVALLLGLLWSEPPSPLDALKTENDLGHRAEKAITLAEDEFDAARQAYGKGDIKGGDDDLDVMDKALDDSVESLHRAHKSRLYKRAELRVALLQRRMQSLLEEINMEQRGWAEQANRHLAEIRDRLLEGALRK